MGRYIIRRLLINIPVLFGITILVFTFTQLAPGDPVSAYLRPELGASAEMREQVRRQLGLDQPAPVRYMRWLGQTLQGNLGYRMVGGQPVNATLGRALRASGVLMGAALVIGCLFGIPLGVLSALRQYSKLDFTLTAVAFLGVSSPSFLLGLGGLYLFGLKLKIFPIGGMFSAGEAFTLLDFLHHLTLPALILGFGYNAILMRYTRSSMLEVIRAAYVTTARAKGLREYMVVFRHTFRNALIPVITIIGLALPEMVGGAVITETVFTWPGMGSLLVDAVNGRDYPLIMGISLSVAVAVLFANLITDITYAFVDPRIRFG
ncbi:MAG: ABC transporter permease [Caldilineaceae bacterium]|nr:ABC transporter permease [Caldilineaceae bacterium]